MERFALPDSLDGLTSDDLNELSSKANERLEALRSVTQPTEEDVAELQTIKDFRTTLKQNRERRAEFSAALEGLEPEVESVEEPEVEPEPEPVEAATEEVVEGTLEEPDPEPEAEPVVAANKPAKRRTPDVSVPEAPAAPQLTIVAAADIPQVPMGSELNFQSLCEAVANKTRVLGRSTARHPVATIEKQFEPGFDLRHMNDIQVMNKLEELASVSNYEKSLTASGGWCAPSEIIYELFETICPNPLLFNLPTFRANRGGVRWPIYEELDFTDVVDFVWTEADDIAVTGTKPCITVTCPVFDECRLDAHGVCVEIGNFIDRAYPEQVAWFLRRVFFLHARAESLRKLNVVLADTEAATVAATFGTASAVVAALLLQVQGYRDRNGLCAGATVEAWAPAWLREAIRADVARQGFHGVGSGLVTDSQINAWFADAGVSINWLNYWQAFEDATAGDRLTWPATVDILLYTPGAYVQFDGGTLDLGVTRDSVLNSTNDFNIFTEDFYCIGRRGPQGVHLTIPICPDGQIGFRQELTCPVA